MSGNNLGGIVIDDIPLKLAACAFIKQAITHAGIA